jgi:hypothetical protein
VELNPLRNGPTQSGVAYPKYYLWAVVRNKTKIITKGAVRVATIEKTHFEITHFVSEEEIQKNPGRLKSIFPSVLVPSILSEAGEKRNFRPTRRTRRRQKAARLSFHVMFKKNQCHAKK